MKKYSDTKLQSLSTYIKKFTPIYTRHTIITWASCSKPNKHQFSNCEVLKSLIIELF